MLPLGDLYDSLKLLSPASTSFQSLLKYIDTFMLPVITFKFILSHDKIIGVVCWISILRINIWRIHCNFVVVVHQIMFFNFPLNNKHFCMHSTRWSLNFLLVIMRFSHTLHACYTTWWFLKFLPFQACSCTSCLLNFLLVDKRFSHFTHIPPHYIRKMSFLIHFNFSLLAGVIL